jgi:hypothetical protein
MTRIGGGTAVSTAHRFQTDGTLLTIEAELKAALAQVQNEIGDARPAPAPAAPLQNPVGSAS